MSGAARRAPREALGLIARARTADAVRAALQALPAADPEVRAAILSRFDTISAAPRRADADCSLRAALLTGLRSRAVPADRELLERATRTYEYGSMGEIAANLRAAALLALSAVDDGVAAFHAVRLLGEAAPGTREPAVTAARLLAVLDQPLPLYARLAGGRAQSEEAAECFRGLTGAPDSILLHLAHDWLDSADEVALLGLLDVLLEAAGGRPEPERFEAALLDFLRESAHLDLVRYLATAVVAGHHERLIGALRAGPWPAPARAAIVAEALDLLASR